MHGIRTQLVPFNLVQLVLSILIAQQVSAASITLHWTAPGDNRSLGRAARYDLRYATSPLSDANWGAATVVSGLPAPSNAGAVENFTVTGLDSSSTYYFGIKAMDKFSNWSPLSNVKSWVSGRYLVVTPASVRFDATEGSSASLASILGLASSDSVSLAFASTETSAWFSLTNPTGTTPGTMTVVANPAGRPAGTYSDSIQVVASGAINSPIWVHVTMNIAAPTASILVVTPDSMKFQRTASDPVPSPKLCLVSEASGRNIDYACSTGSSWMTLSRSTGTTPDSIFVGLNAANLSPDSMLIDSVRLTSSHAVNVPRWVVVKVTTQIAASVKALVTTPDSLHFAATQGFANPPTQTFNVTEASGSSHAFTLTSSASWLVLPNPNGTAPAAMAVAVNTSGLAVGHYMDSVQVSSSGVANSPLWVRVSLDVQPQPDRLSIDKDSLVFYGVEGDTNPSPSSFAISETHGRGIAFNCSRRVTWVTVRDSSGTTPAGVTVSALTNGLTTGAYVDSIQISANSAANSPLWLKVVVHVTSAPALTFSSVTVFNVTTTSATVSWSTNRPALSQVLYGATELYGHSTPMTATKSTSHVAIIDNLAPTTRYHFQLVCDPGTGVQVSRDSTFETSNVLRADGGPVYNVLQPTLTVENMVLPPGSVVGSKSATGSNLYYFSVARDSSFTSIVVASPAIPEQPDAKTSWKIPQPLDPGRQYYWRASINNVIFTAVQAFVVTGDVHAYPNPFRPTELPNVTFTGLPRGSNLLIITITGEQIRRWTHNSGQDLLWDGRNESGTPVATGTYLWYVENSDIKGKLIIIR